MTIYLIQCGQTDWRATGRLQGQLSLPLSAIGVEEAENLARRLSDTPLDAMYSSTCEACVQTARAIARQSKSRPKVRQVAGLDEVNLGLWQGMLAEDVRRRQPRVYRQWQDEPESVTPPGGENVAAAYKRVVAALDKIVRRRDSDDAIAVVVSPMAAAMLRCHLGHRPLAELWSLVRLHAGEPEQFAGLAVGE